MSKTIWGMFLGILIIFTLSITFVDAQFYPDSTQDDAFGSLEKAVNNDLHESKFLTALLDKFTKMKTEYLRTMELIEDARRDLRGLDDLITDGGTQIVYRNGKLVRLKDKFVGMAKMAQLRYEEQKLAFTHYDYMLEKEKFIANEAAWRLKLNEVRKQEVILFSINGQQHVVKYRLDGHSRRAGKMMMSMSELYKVYATSLKIIDNKAVRTVVNLVAKGKRIGKMIPFVKWFFIGTIATTIVSSAHAGDYQTATQETMELVAPGVGTIWSISEYEKQALQSSLNGSLVDERAALYTYYRDNFPDFRQMNSAEKRAFIEEKLSQKIKTDPDLIWKMGTIEMINNPVDMGH